MLHYIVRNGKPWDINMGHLEFIGVPINLASKFVNKFNLVHYTPTKEEVLVFLKNNK